ncbi:MAG: hypothetical protein JKY54_15205 [Flavobacteriales bacterium]|nr:hypothetical protein [Flavobacteriales bacterium]
MPKAYLVSDFGAIIYITKTDASFFNSTEIIEVTLACEQLAKETTLANSLSDPYLFNVGKSIDYKDKRCHTVNVLLSDH